MTSIRALANLHCVACNETTLHTSNVCPCGATSKVSGNPPVPRPARPYGYSTVRNFSAAQAEQHQARKRAALARHQFQRGVSKT